MRLITAISGAGGLGKTRLLDELEWYRPTETIFSRLDAGAGFGCDGVRLLRVLSNSLHREGEAIPTPHFDQCFQQRQNLFNRAISRSPKQLLRHFYRATLLGVDSHPPAGKPRNRSTAWIIFTGTPPIQPWPLITLSACLPGR